MLLVDFQAGLGFGVESASRQVLLNNALALARTAVAFSVPVIVSTSASRVYSGPDSSPRRVCRFQRCRPWTTASTYS
jgi:hypothetical protein